MRHLVQLREWNLQRTGSYESMTRRPRIAHLGTNPTIPRLTSIRRWAILDRMGGGYAAQSFQEGSVMSLRTSITVFASLFLVSMLGVQAGCPSKKSGDRDATVQDGGDGGGPVENTNALCQDGLDNDGDGLTDCADDDCLGNPDITVCDADADGIADSDDNCPNTANPDQADYDHDGQGDVCDPDADNDGYAAADGDCDDLDEAVHPGAQEIADGKDNDCNAQIDDGTAFVVYQVPAISDNGILPDTDLPSDATGYETSLRATPGEFEPASFVVRAKEDVSSLTLELDDLSGPSGVISADAVDIRVVKVWYQAGFSIGDQSHKHLTPELLLKDDSLVKVENQDNFVKVGPGQYVKISDPSGVPGISNRPTNEEFPVHDSTDLQPVDIPTNTNKQFWITVRVPDDAVAGTYQTKLRIKDPNKLLGQIDLQVEVLPFTLPSPMVGVSLYYSSRIADQGTISNTSRNEEQIRAELKNLVDHGVTNPTVYAQGGTDHLLQMLAMRDDAGMSNGRLYYLDLQFMQAPTTADVQNRVQNMLTTLAPAGVSDLYVYAPDEQNLDTPDMRARITAVHDGGAKVLDAQRTSYAIAMADILDLAIVSHVPDPAIADLYHQSGHLVGSYANPQVGEEKPAKYRKNYGLLLWQKGYDISMDFAYDWSMNNIWDDFDHTVYRDHNFVYPTTNGVIDTIQWEGFREGVDDMRYLTLLLNLLDERGECCEDHPLSDCCPAPVYSAYIYVQSLKTDGLDPENLDTVRARLIDFILWLVGKGPAPIFCGNGVIEQGEECDGNDFGGKTCADFGYATGHLSCKACTTSLSDCIPATASIRFVDPTPTDGATVTQDHFTIAVHAESVAYSVVDIAFQGDDGLVAHWAFDETSGTQVSDDSPHGNDGALDQGEYETADTGTTASSIHETSRYSLSYHDGTYNGWFVKALDGAAANAVATVSNFVVSDIQNDKTIQLASALSGFAAGDAYHLYANTQMPTFATGKYHGAVWLDGADDYVQLGSGAPSLSQLTGDGLTIAAWIDPASPASHQRIITKNGPFSLGLSANMLVGSVYANQIWAHVTGHTPITADQWVHVALVYDGQNVILYVNGIPDGSTPLTGDLEGGGCVQIGRGNNGGCYGDPGQHFEGGIDDLFIYNRGLSASEVTAIARSHVHDVTRDITGLGAGTYTISASSKDIDGHLVQTEVRTVHVSP